MAHPPASCTPALGLSLAQLFGPRVLGVLRSLRVGVALLLLLSAPMAWASPVAEAQTALGPEIDKVQVQIRARTLHAQAQELRLHARYHFRNWRAGQTLHLLNFSESLEKLEGKKRLEMMPHLHATHNESRLEVRSVKIGGQKQKFTRVGARRDLHIAPLSKSGAPMRGSIDVEYTLRVPRRSWPFGCVRGRCALSGAVAPLPSRPLGDKGQWVVEPTRWEVKWPECANRPKALFVSDSEGRAQEKIFFPSVAWDKRVSTEAQQSSFFHRGVLVKIWGARGRGTEETHPRGAWNWRKNVRRELATSARYAIDAAIHFGVDLGWGDQLPILVGPYFAEISMPIGQHLLVSSNYLDVLPFKRFADFHRNQLTRSLLDALVMQGLLKRGLRTDDFWVAGAVGSELARRTIELGAHKSGDIEDAVSALKFMPMIDQMLYGGQTSNAGAFFSSVEDPLPLRNHTLYFSHQMPRGGRLASKLRDALGQDKFEEWVDKSIQDKATQARPLARSLSKGKLNPNFFKQWLGTYPEVDYAIVDIRRRRAEGGWICEVDLARQSEEDVLESIEVRFEMRDKSEASMVWKPRGKGMIRKTLVFKSASKVKRVRLDPHTKLAQVSLIPSRSWEGRNTTDPLFNDQKPAGFRFLYTGIGLHLAIAEFLSSKTSQARVRSFDGYMSFAGGLRRDLRREFSLLIAKDRDTYFNLGAGMAFFFGPKVTSNRRRLKLAAESNVDLLAKSGFDPTNGIRATQTLSILDDTQDFIFEPHGGHTRKLSLKRSDVWTPLKKSNRQHSAFWKLELDLRQRFQLANGHVLAVQALGEMMLTKDTPEFRGLTRLGGVGRLSAFGADEVFARAVALGIAEYRHTIFDHLRVNLLGLGWIRNLGGALSGGIGTASSCESFSGLGAKGSWYGQIGYGVSALYDFMGMAPEMVRLDVSLPIGRKNRSCLGREFPEAIALAQDHPVENVKSLLPRLSFNILIDQPF